jgi:hypothetical protein
VEIMTEFRLNDVVEAFGLRGTVVKIYSEFVNPVEVKYEDGEYTLFTLDGKLHHHHKLPSLKLISRAKRKVKKEIKFWVNVYPGKKYDILFVPYAKEEIAHGRTTYGAIAVAVECTGFYEVEVDE